MLSGKDVGAIAGGTVVGVVQTVATREIDNVLANNYLKEKAAGSSPTPPLLMKQLGNFGGLSVLVNGPLSAIELGVGLYSAMNRAGHGIRSTHGQEFLVAAGAGGLTGTFASMAFAPVQWSNAVEVDPSRPFRSATSTVRINGQTRSTGLGGAVVA